jgi:hypothetical protein
MGTHANGVAWLDYLDKRCPECEGEANGYRGGSRMELSIEFLIRARQADTADALREYAERRLSFALRRFADQVEHATVRLLDVNGPAVVSTHGAPLPQT